MTTAAKRVTPRIDLVSDTAPPWTRPVEPNYSWPQPVTPDQGLGVPDEYGENARSLLARLDDSSTWGCGCALHREPPGPKSWSSDTNEEMTTWL